MAIVLLLPILFSACSGQQDLELGTYVSESYYDSNSISLPGASLLLKDDNEFTLYGPAFISYTPAGKYKIDNGKLTLTVSNDNIYTFLIDEDKLIFESGEWLENWVEQGTVFHLSTE